MTIYDPGVVDRVVAPPDSQQVDLCILVPEALVANEELMGLIQAKVNLYIAYVEGGQLASDYPDLANRSPWVQIVFDGGKSEFVESVASHLGTQLAARGIGLEMVDFAKLRG